MSRSSRLFFPLTRPTYHTIALSRPVLRLQRSYANHERQQQVQTVRFYDPKGGARRAGEILGKITFYIVCGWYILDRVLEEDSEEEKAKAGAKLPPKALKNVSENDATDREEEEEKDIQLPVTMPEDAVFIPLWFPKEKPHYFYKGSDPEWQNYATLAKDEEKCKQLQQRIVSILVQEMNHNRKVSRWFGQPIKPRRVWLDFDWPAKAPKEYETPGLEIADEYIALTKRPLSEKQYARIQHALWPQSVATSFYVSYRTFWSLQYAKLKRLLNIKSGGGDQASQLDPRAIDLLQFPKSKRKESSHLDAGLDKMADSKSPNTPNTKSTPDSPPATSPDSSRILGSLPSMPRLTGDAAKAVTAFRQTLSKTWRAPVALERGQVPITGLVEIEGSRGLAVFDVTALYDPVKSGLVTISFQPRRSALKKQAPLGGP